jgi:hypothetical protein
MALVIQLLLALGVVCSLTVQAFAPLRPAMVQPRRVCAGLQMTSSSDNTRVTKALTAFTVAVGLFGANPPAFADTALKAALKDVKEGAAATATVAAPAPAPGYKADTYKVPKAAPAAKAKSAPAPAPAPVQYTIKPDTELLSKLKSVQKTSQVGLVPPVVTVATPAPTPARAAPPAAAPAPKAAAAPASASATPKLPQEVALQAAISKKASEKARLQELKYEIDAAKKQAEKSKNELSKLQGKLDALEKKLEKKDLSRYVQYAPRGPRAP